MKALSLKEQSGRVIFKQDCSLGSTNGLTDGVLIYFRHQLSQLEGCVLLRIIKQLSSYTIALMLVYISALPCIYS